MARRDVSLATVFVATLALVSQQVISSNVIRPVRLSGRHLSQATSRLPRSPYPPRRPPPQRQQASPPPSPPPKAPPPSAQSFIPVKPIANGYYCPDTDAIFNQTNSYRLRHQVPPLVWDDDLTVGAAAYAQKLASQSCSSTHSKGSDYGENLMMVQQLPKPDNTCLIAMKSWYAEVANYNFGTYQAYTYNWPRNVGHFTQMVWKSTTRVGCGVGVADLPMQVVGRTYIGGCKIIACWYKSYGNVGLDAAFLKNVLPNITKIVV